MEKDIHLIAAALAADQTVLSWDNRVATVIRKVCADNRTVTSKAVAHVLWINPIADKETLHAWLTETGPAQSYWQLGAVSISRVAARRSGGRSTRRGQQ